MLGESAGGPRVRRRDRAGIGNGRLRSGNLLGVVQVIRGSHRNCHSNQVGLSRLAGQSQHGHQGHYARSTTDEDGRSLGGPDEPETDWSPNLELVTDNDPVMQELRDLAALQSLHSEFDIGRNRWVPRPPNTTAMPYTRRVR